MKKKITILGHCNVSLGIILDSLYSVYGSNIVVTIVNNVSSENNRFNDVPFKHRNIKTVEIDAEKWMPDEESLFVLSGMSPSVKRTIHDFFNTHFTLDSKRFISVIHSSAVVTNGVDFCGVVNISPLSVIAQYAQLNHFVSINRNSSIGHHTIIDDFSSVNPGCNIGGSCKIGKDVVIGIGSTIFDGITVGDGAVIGAGSVVTKNVEASTLVYGSPAKFVRNV